MILFGIDRLIGAMFEKMKDIALIQNPYHEWTKTAYILDKCDAECLVVGSSKAERSYVTEILQDSLKMSVYNGGQGGCFFLFQNCVINMLLDRDKPKLIIWDVQPECLQVGSTMQEYQNIRYLSPYYDNDQWANMYINSESERSAVKMKCHMFRYNSKFIQYVMPILGGDRKTQGGYSPLPTTGYIYPKLNSAIENIEGCKLDTNKIDIYEKTLARCKEKGIEMILYVSPAFSLKNETYKSSLTKLNDMANKYGFKLMDFSSDKRFLCDSTLFKDAGHLNDNGACFYTQIIANKILNN